MSSVERSPKKSQKKLPSLPQTQSVPDICTAAAVVLTDKKNRHKRARGGSSPKSALHHQELDDEDDEELDTQTTKTLQKQTRLIAKLVADVAEIKALNIKIQESNTEIRKTNCDIERSMSFMNQKFEDLKKEVEDLRKDRLEQRVYIERLERKILDLQHKSRSSGIEIRNIPLSDNETTSELTKTVCNLTKLVGVPIVESELRDVYRLPGKSTSASARPIIAEFSTVRAKQNVLSAIRTYNNNMESREEKLNTEKIGIPGKCQAVYVAEQLPPSTKKLFYLAREFAKNNQYTFCWIKNGNIFLRKKVGDKQLLVDSEKYLQELVNKPL